MTPASLPATAICPGCQTMVVLPVEPRGPDDPLICGTCGVEVPDYRLEATISVLVGVIVLAFGLEALRAQPSWGGVAGGLLIPHLDGSASVELMSPEESVAPGQACVFYERDGTRVLGGGWIVRAEACALAAE